MKLAPRTRIPYVHITLKADNIEFDRILVHICDLIGFIIIALY